MQTSLDLNQGHGTRKVATGAWTGTAVDLAVLTGGTNSGRAIFDLGNSTTDTEIVYWPITKAVRGGEVVGFAAVVELLFLGGVDFIKKSHPDVEILSLIQFEE